MLSNFVIIPVVREKIKIKLFPAIPTGAPTTLTGEIIQTPSLVAPYLCNQKQQNIYSIF